MMPAPVIVQRSTLSLNSSQPNSVTSGSCRKLIGVSAETSPRRNARVHSSWPMVPSTPVASSHSQAVPVGQTQTNRAGTSDSGTQNT
ncbi:hypothetical protein G6F22_019467 [Rhizopus arrhizus]|nr:hypothetical protein G6F22_019467 [Rhizopus arrhizus]